MRRSARASRAAARASSASACAPARRLVRTRAIGVVGGLFGCLFGLAAIQAVVAFTGWPAVIEPHFVIVALSISAGVAILAGLYPARRAAAMDPIGALRYQ